MPQTIEQQLATMTAERDFLHRKLDTLARTIQQVDGQTIFSQNIEQYWLRLRAFANDWVSGYEAAEAPPLISIMDSIIQGRQ